jgi:hypothetical protein
MKSWMLNILSCAATDVFAGLQESPDRVLVFAIGLKG